VKRAQKNFGTRIRARTGPTLRRCPRARAPRADAACAARVASDVRTGEGMCPEQVSDDLCSRRGSAITARERKIFRVVIGGALRPAGRGLADATWTRTRDLSGGCSPASRVERWRAHG